MSEVETIRADDLAARVESIVKGHIDEVHGQIKKDVSEAARSVRKTLASRSGSPWRTGAYARSWSSRTTTGELVTSSVVYNKSHYQITHLLELGHGGPAPAPANPHIRPAYEKGVEALLARMR